MTRKQTAGALSLEETQRLELVRDVLLELGAMPTQGQPARAIRAETSLEVSFKTQDEAVRAFSKNIGSGGIAIATNKALAVGATVVLNIKLPDQAELAIVEGRVAWTKPDSMGIAFEKIRPQDESRLKQVLIRDEGVLRRLKSVLTSDVRDIAAKSRDVLTTDIRELKQPKPATATEVDNRQYVQILLGDAAFATVAAEVLSHAGYRAVVGPVSTPPAVVVADTTSAPTVLGSSKLILVNVSGPDALVGRLTQLRPAAFIRRPATGAAIAQAVQNLLGPAR